MIAANPGWADRECYACNSLNAVVGSRQRPITSLPLRGRLFRQLRSIPCGDGRTVEDLSDGLWLGRGAARKLNCRESDHCRFSSDHLG
jgi:hypothetical protein